jgi:glycosyltransferase involved in cell wall biosynthesis
MKQITVFTPTFNRAYCLHNLYESLVIQTSQDFSWLIIDDGSSDNTRELVDSWIHDGKVAINYIYQENQGMHGAHNTAYRNIDTELNVCIDSDDYMPADAIAIILGFWNKNKKGHWAGLIGLDAFTDGKIVGTAFPKGMTECKYYRLKSEHKVFGDKKFVYRTDIIKKYPEYPVFKGERFVPLGYKYMLIDQDYSLGVMHDVLCIVEYMPDGSSKNIINQYRRNPHGFAFERKMRMVYSHTLKERFSNSVHYVSSAIFLKNPRFLNESPKKILTLLAVPFGIVLNLYIRYTGRSGIMK